MLTNPNARKWVYIGNQAIGLVLLILSALSIIDEGTASNIEGTVGSVVMLLVGELARRNINPKPAVIGDDGVARITDAVEAYATQTQQAITATVDQVGTIIGNAIGAPSVGELISNAARGVEQVINMKDFPAPPRGESGQSDAVELTRAQLERRLVMQHSGR